MQLKNSMGMFIGRGDDGDDNYGSSDSVTFTLESKSHPKFNKTWRASGSLWSTPPFIQEWIDTKCRELGLAEAPEDLEFSGTKD